MLNAVCQKQYASQHVFLDSLTHNPPPSRKCITHSSSRVLHENIQDWESTNIWQLINKLTDDKEFNSKYSMSFLCTVNILTYSCCTEPSGRVSANVYFYIYTLFRCAPTFSPKTLTDVGASESRLNVYCHDRVVCPNCLHTACISMYWTLQYVLQTKSKSMRFRAPPSSVLTVSHLDANYSFSFQPSASSCGGRGQGLWLIVPDLLNEAEKVNLLPVAFI